MRNSIVYGSISRKNLIFLIIVNTIVKSNLIDISQIADNPTPKELILSRLTPRMEFRVAFISQSVPWKLHLVYLERFRKQFLKSEFESLYADIVRFLCLIIRPPNNVHRIDTLQRWQLICTLFSFIKSSSGAQSAKLALFFDWMHFDNSPESFMAIGSHD